MNFLCILIGLFSSLQSASAEDAQRGWLGIFSRKESTDKTYISHQEVQLRYSFEDGGNQQLLARFGLLKPLNESHETGILMGYIETSELKEYRPTLQHVYQKRNGTQRFALRSRLEWRDWEDQNTNSVRYRLQALFQHPLTEKFALTIWEEPFVNLTQEHMSGNRFFERNRAFAGVRISGSAFSYEVGYLNQLVTRQNNLNEHVLVLYVYF